MKKLRAFRGRSIAMVAVLLVVVIGGAAIYVFNTKLEYADQAEPNPRSSKLVTVASLRGSSVADVLTALQLHPGEASAVKYGPPRVLAIPGDAAEVPPKDFGSYTATAICVASEFPDQVSKKVPSARVNIAAVPTDSFDVNMKNRLTGTDPGIDPVLGEKTGCWVGSDAFEVPQG